jgi:hypothetical protein
MDSLSNLIHHCDEMPRAGVSICRGADFFDSDDLGWCLLVERLATEDDLHANPHLEEVGDTLWTTAVEIKCCPYCGIELTDARCPQFQGRVSRQWTERKRNSDLPVAYYHLVFTLAQLEHPMVPTTEAHGEEEACPTCPLCGGVAGLQWLAELIPRADWARRRRR